MSRRILYLNLVCTVSQSSERFVCGERGVLTPPVEWAASIDEKASGVLWAATKRGRVASFAFLTDAIETTTRSCADRGRAEGPEKKSVARLPLRCWSFELALLCLMRTIMLPH